MTLTVRDLRFAYARGDPVLRGATLEVPPGESGFLLGPSGCGKSTLLRCIAGLTPGYEGTVRFEGEPLDGLPPHKRRVGMLFQEPALFPHLNVWRNVAFGLQYLEPESPNRRFGRFGLRYRGLPRREHRAEAERWLDVVNLSGKPDARVDELSGGQRQRVALARTLAARPRVVLLDEPLSSLDRDLRDDLGVRLKNLLAEQGVSALWVTHDREEAHRLGDRVWTLEEGRTVPSPIPPIQEPTPHDLPPARRP